MALVILSVARQPLHKASRLAWTIIAQFEELPAPVGMVSSRVSLPPPCLWSCMFMSHPSPLPFSWPPGLSFLPVSSWGSSQSSLQSESPAQNIALSQVSARALSLRSTLPSHRALCPLSGACTGFNINQLVSSCRNETSSEGATSIFSQAWVVQSGLLHPSQPRPPQRQPRPQGRGLGRSGCFFSQPRK